MSLPSQVLRRLTREITKLQRTPPEGICIQVGEQDMFDVQGWIQGPTGTPYSSGYFLVKFDFLGVDFPSSPPKCIMKTKIFHPNINSNGEICVSTLKKDWSSKYGIEHILLVIKCLLITPNPNSALDAEAGRLLQDAYAEYAHTASMWTRIHASQCPPCFPSVSSVKVDSASISISSKLNNGEGSSTARPLTQSDSTNQSLSHKASFGGTVIPSLLSASISPIEGTSKRKSDEYEKPEAIIAKKRQTVVKRGIKRL